jgi:hypothetical protein
MIESMRTSMVAPVVAIFRATKRAAVRRRMGLKMPTIQEIPAPREANLRPLPEKSW